jgi:hypothetical protein
MKASALAVLLDQLPADKRDALLRIQPAAVRQVLTKPKGSKTPTVSAEARREGDVVTLVCKGLRLVNGANDHSHWRKQWERDQATKALVVNALARITVPPSPWRVTIVRVGPRRLDGDGATISAKYVQDGIAAWAGVDDGDPRWTWEPVVRERGGYCVRVTIRSTGEGGRG